MCLHLSFCLVLIIYQGVLLDKISIRIFLFLNKILTAKTLLLFPDAFINWMVQEKKKKDYGSVWIELIVAETEN